MMACKFFILLICVAIFFCHVDTFKFNVSNIKNHFDTFMLNVSNIKNDINYINSLQSSWKADFSSLSGLGLNAWKNKLGIRLIPKQLKKLKKFKNRFSFAAPLSGSSGSGIPRNYDLRDAWPACNSLVSLVRDQSACGSCWAVASASVFSDRYCIHEKGAFTLPFSAEDLMRCCHECKNSNDNGCDGGDVVQAMFHMMDYGIVTGGEYNSEKGCMPYSFAPCSSSDINAKKGTCAYVEKGARTEKCQKKCTNPTYMRRYSRDKRSIADAYIFSVNAEDLIQEEIMKNGSCIATMEVYKDFLVYKSGIYHHVEGEKIGDHGVRLIGWGVENGIEYWLVANSWGESWGEKGLFKIRRKDNKCKFRNIICPFL